MRIVGQIRRQETKDNYISVKSYVVVVVDSSGLDLIWIKCIDVLAESSSSSFTRSLLSLHYLLRVVIQSGRNINDSDSLYTLQFLPYSILNPSFFLQIQSSPLIYNGEDEVMDRTVSRTTHLRMWIIIRLWLCHIFIAFVIRWPPTILLFA